MSGKPRIKGFPDAPPGSYLSPEGWLVVGDEAWTQAEWAKPDRVRFVPDLEDPTTERRRKWREYKRRTRGQAA